MDTINQLLKTIERIDGAYAASTIRAYRSNFTKFIDYCELVGAVALPAAPETIAAFVGQLTEDGYHSSTIRQVVASIASIHTLNNYASIWGVRRFLLEKNIQL